MKLFNVIFISVLAIILTGCLFEKKNDDISGITPDIKIPAKEGSPEDAISQIITTEKKMALTFNGLADEETMLHLLDELDRFEIKATFFLPGMRVAEDPELANEILNRGHSVQNNTLNHVLPDNLDYERAYVEILHANKVFYEHLNHEPTYVRSRSGDSSPAFEEAAAQLNMRVVTNTINPKDRQLQSAEEIAAYVKRFAIRGAIIELNTYINPEVIRAIEFIYKDAVEANFNLTTFEEVLAGSYIKDKNPETNNLRVNSNYNEVKPKIIEKFNTNKKEVALTIDDWASDETISAVLDILDTYQIKSTFFLIGSGVERNPSLVKVIADRGHEIASHSYAHKDVPEMGVKELQEDVIKNDHVLSYALQEKPLNYFRPARGILDEKSAKVITATGVDFIIMYDISSHDWDLSLSEDEVYNRVINGTVPGSIIVMHILDESHTINVLPRILEQLKQQGYSFRKISEMIAEHN